MEPLGAGAVITGDTDAPDAIRIPPGWLPLMRDVTADVTHVRELSIHLVLKKRPDVGHLLY